jgi:hypothetical protein
MPKKSVSVRSASPATRASKAAASGGPAAGTGAASFGSPGDDVIDDTKPVTVPLKVLFLFGYLFVIFAITYQQGRLWEMVAAIHVACGAAYIAYTQDEKDSNYKEIMAACAVLALAALAYTYTIPKFMNIEDFTERQAKAFPRWAKHHAVCHMILQQNKDVWGIKREISNTPKELKDVLASVK